MPLRKNLPLACSLLALAALGLQAQEAKVAVANGVPLISFDGKPLPHLIFAGSSLGLPAALPAGAWTRVEYSAKAPLDDPDAFVQINFGSGRGALLVRDFSITEDSSKSLLESSFRGEAWRGSWTFRDANASGAKATATPDGLLLEVPKRQEFPWDVQLCSGKLKLREGHEYKVSFEAKASFDGWPLSSYLMHFNPLRFYASNGRDMFKDAAALALPEGVEILSPTPAIPWPSPEQDFEQEFKTVDAALASALENAPSAKLILRLGVEPPAWWRKENPAELEKWEDGKTSNYVCVASKKWLADSRAHLLRCVRRLEAKWGSRIIGYAPVAQSTGEWYYPVWTNQSSGPMNFAAPFVEGYREFLKAKYGSPEALAKAWNTPCSSFAAIQVPSGEERAQAALGLFRDPAKQRALYDFADYQRQAMSDALENAAAAIKEACGRRKLVFAFYGYLFEHAGIQSGLGATGHLNLGRLLRSDNLDCVVDIVSYYDRGARGSAALMSASESIMAHGKLLCTEDDSRTHLSAPNAGYERYATQDETAWAQSRNLLRSLARNGYTRKFDLYGSGWFGDKKLWQELGALTRAYESLPKRPLRTDIAVIADERSMLALKPGVELTRPLLFDFRSAIARSGAGEPGYWLLDDFIEGRVPKAKLLVFLNAFLLSESQRTALARRCAENGGSALWLYAPGYLDDAKGESFEAMRALTGFEFKRHPRTAGAPANLRPLAGDSPLAAKSALPLPEKLGEYFEALPSAATQGIAQFPEGGIALARNERDGWTSYFCATPALSPGFLAKLAELSGAWRYAPEGNIVISDGRLLGVCAPKAGSVPLYLPEGAKLKRLDGSAVQEKSPAFEFKAGETKIFLIEN